MTTPLSVVDVETFGLDPDRHDIFEIALIRRDDAGDWHEFAWWVGGGNIGVADSNALRINRFYERASAQPPLANPEDVAAELATLTAGTHLVACNPAFDAVFLERFLRRNGLAPAWDYHLVDVEAALASRLEQEPPWRSDDLAKAVGIEPPTGAQRHTALADARMAKAMYEAAFGIRPTPAKGRRRTEPTPERTAEMHDAIAEQRADQAEPADEPTDTPADETPAEDDAGEVPEAVNGSGRPDISQEHPCSEDGCEEIVDGEFAVLSYSRYRRVLCKPHFAAMKVS